MGSRQTCNLMKDLEEINYSYVIQSQFVCISEQVGRPQSSKTIASTVDQSEFYHGAVEFLSNA